MSQSEKIIAVYVIKNKLDNKIYIGSSNDLKRRFRDHISLLNRKCHHSIHLQNAWNKYGKENFTFEILEEIIDEKQLLIKEQNYLETYNSYNKDYGYNISKIPGSNFKGRNHTEETKKIQSEKNSGENHWAYGKILTKEHKEKISKSNKKIPKELENEVIEKYNSIKNAYHVAKQYNVHAETIYRILRKNGIKRK